MNLRGKKIGIIGLGLSGIAAAKLLKRNGAIPFVSDFNSNKVLKNRKRELDSIGIACEIGQHYLERYREFDLIVVSPGIDLRDYPVLDEFGIPIISEIELGYLYTKGKIIAVTGSNGKSTTVTLIAEIYKNEGLPYFLAGNIGLPFCEIADKTTDEHTTILELSSFQLERIRDFRADISILLNLTPDHLNRYDNVESYYKTKINLFNKQGSSEYAILNADDKNVLQKSQALNSSKVFFSSMKDTVPGCYLKNDRLTINLTGENDIELVSYKDLGIPGPHNIYNSMASALASYISGISIETISNTLKNFSGLHHRLELVREIDGVRFINDSKSTNLDSLKYALKTFEERFVLIAGGYDKKGSFDDLVNHLPDNLVHVVLIGQTAEKIESVIGEKVKCSFADNLKDAVKKAYKYTKPGEIVMLSPGCASYDMFENFEKRGEIFKKIVQEI